MEQTPLQALFDACTVEGQTIKPPTERVDPKVYADAKKVFLTNLAKWKGGKAQCFAFDFDPTDLLTQLQAGERPNLKKDWHYFPTPPEVIEKMCDILIPCDSMRLLEPSAGRGAIVEYVNKVFPFAEHDWVLLEPNLQHHGPLNEKGLTALPIRLEEYKTDKLFDAIYANPPFRHAKAHLELMFDLLVDDGTAVVVLPQNFPEKHEAWLEEQREKFAHISCYDVPPGAFSSSGTQVATTIMHAAYRAW